MALCVGDTILPVHKCLMMVSSSVFSDVLGSQCEQHATSGTAGYGQIMPLINEDEASIKEALSYVYQKLYLCNSAPEIVSIDQAKLLAQFSAKYDILAVLGDCDIFVEQWLT